MEAVAGAAGPQGWVTGGVQGVGAWSGVTCRGVSEQCPLSPRESQRRLLTRGSGPC